VIFRVPKLPMPPPTLPGKWPPEMVSPEMETTCLIVTKKML
jgi:hypothetical protein